jgi:hypothetical protein
MAAGGEQSATMELNPPDLGPLQVVLSVNKDQATAAFSSAAPEVRQALESALPKLKEMMSEAGIQLGSATVSAGMSDQNNSAYSQQASSAQSGSGNGSNRGGSSYGRDTGSDAEAARTTQPCAACRPERSTLSPEPAPPSPANRERRPALPVLLSVTLRKRQAAAGTPLFSADPTAQA